MNRRTFVLGLLLLVSAIELRAADPADSTKQSDDANSAAVRFFESRVRPLFAKHCFKCHGEEEQEANLRLDSPAEILRGGDSGPAISPGKPEGSLLLTAVGYDDPELQMPPDGKLSQREIDDLTHWIKTGAALPDYTVDEPKTTVKDGNAREFWAFQPPTSPQLPSVENHAWPGTPIDFFVLANLEANKLRPVSSADRRTLIRRATFDLIGLPPTPQEIDAFLSDDSPEAFAKVIDRLLASPRYGERWGRHWLDVARYADSNGLDENIAHGNAWRYRDYVIAAMNNDKPFNQFVIEQLAGDLLPPTDNLQTRIERLVATGFLSLGPKVLAEVDETKMEMDIVDEQIDTFGRAFLGLTFGCARCHAHKFDPLTQEDYYALAGIFKSTKTMEHFKKIARWHENDIATPADLARKSEYDKKVADQKSAIDALVQKANEQLKASLAPGKKLPENPESQYPEETKAELKRLRDALAELEKAAPEMPTAMGVTEGSPENVPVHIRGSHLTLGEIVPRQFPEVLTTQSDSQIDNGHSGRLELAEWLVDNDHPLTARVIVNRIWRWHFGRGLVGTTDNFGKLGDRPINQPLLDWLARGFVDSGWSIKELHRLIMLSSTYQMSSQFDEQNAQIDPANRQMWRMNVRRLEAEAIRDSLLAVGGGLDLSMGGSMLHVKNRTFLFDHTSKDETTYDNARRSIYQPVIRNHLYDVFQLFDFTDASTINGDRTTSTVAPQALFMMNSDLVADAAEELAAAVLGDDLDNTRRVETLYQRCYGRPANDTEVARALALVERASAEVADDEQDAASRQRQAWGLLCHVLLSSNEFVYLR